VQLDCRDSPAQVICRFNPGRGRSGQFGRGSSRSRAASLGSVPVQVGDEPSPAVGEGHIGRWLPTKSSANIDNCTLAATRRPAYVRPSVRRYVIYTGFTYACSRELWTTEVTGFADRSSRTDVVQLVLGRLVGVFAARPRSRMPAPKSIIRFFRATPPSLPLQQRQQQPSSRAMALFSRMTETTVRDSRRWSLETHAPAIEGTRRLWSSLPRNRSLPRTRVGQDTGQRLNEGGRRSSPSFKSFILLHDRQMTSRRPRQCSSAQTPVTRSMTSPAVSRVPGGERERVANSSANSTTESIRGGFIVEQIRHESKKGVWTVVRNQQKK
jgi:hypothetical protein